jgi:rare lipoprotein A
MIRGAAIALLAVSTAVAQPVQRGNASWYGEEHRGLTMANGRPFNPDALTCASWFYPLGTVLHVRCDRRSVYVVVTDRGPRSDLVASGRVIDLSRRAFELLGNLRVGLLPVEIRPAMQITDHQLREILQASHLPGYLWQLADSTYETVSADWVVENWNAWLESRPSELVVFGDAAGKTIRLRPLWIAEACDCDDLSIGNVAYAQVGNALSAQKTRLPRGGLAFGFLFYMAGPSRVENFGVSGMHSINWFIDHDSTVRFFEPGVGRAVELLDPERATATFGLAA